MSNEDEDDTPDFEPQEEDEEELDEEQDEEEEIEEDIIVEKKPAPAPAPAKGPVTTDKRPSTSVEGTPSEQEIERDVLAISHWRKRSPHGRESPYLEKLRKYQSMASGAELKATIEKLIKEMEGQTSGDKPGEKILHSAKTRQGDL